MTRTWFITGVSTGFGRYLTEQLLARGDRVAGTVRNLDSVSDITSDAFHVSLLDMTDTARIREVVDAAHAHFGRLDVVVSNAGYGLMGAAEELSDDQVRHQLDTNLLGSIQLIRAALPHLREDGGGRILQLSSVGGQVAWPGGSLYHATKWAVEGFADAVAEEVAPFGIGVTIVEPGGARTEFRYGSSRLAEKIDAYEASPANRIRRVLEEGTSVAIGDPARMATLMIDSVDQDPAPRRLVLGSDAWTAMTAALEARLDDIRGQKTVAFSTDFD